MHPIAPHHHIEAAQACQGMTNMTIFILKIIQVGVSHVMRNGRYMKRIVSKLNRAIGVTIVILHRCSVRFICGTPLSLVAE